MKHLRSSLITLSVRVRAPKFQAERVKGRDLLVKDAFLQVSVGVKLVEHVVLFVIVWRQDDEHDNALDRLPNHHTQMSASQSQALYRSSRPAHLLLLLRISLNLLRIPHLLISLARVKVLVLIQRQFDDELVVSQFQILLHRQPDLA